MGTICVWTSCRARRGRWDAHQPLHHRRYAKHISLPNSNLLRATQNTAIFHKRLPAPSPTPLPHLRLFAFKLNFPLRCVRSSALSFPAHPAPTRHRTVTPFFPANYIHMCVPALSKSNFKLRYNIDFLRVFFSFFLQAPCPSPAFVRRNLIWICDSV